METDIPPATVEGPERGAAGDAHPPEGAVRPCVTALPSVTAAVAVWTRVPPGSVPGWGRNAALLSCVFALLVLTVIPYLCWQTSTFAVTTRTSRVRTGILYRDGSDIPISRVTNVVTHQGILDRLLGRGTLVAKQAADPEGVSLDDVPHVERVRCLITELAQLASLELPQGRQGGS